MEYVSIAVSIAVCFLNICSFVLGVWIGKQSTHSEPIEISNPVTVVKEKKEHAKANKLSEKEQERMNKILQNIDNYNGDSTGQIDVD